MPPLNGFHKVALDNNRKLNSSPTDQVGVFDFEKVSEKETEIANEDNDYNAALQEFKRINNSFIPQVSLTRTFNEMKASVKIFVILN